MTIQDIYQQFVTDIQYVRWQEWVSTIAQIASVWYARKNNILVYPTGIIGVLLASWVYFFLATPPLYADAILNVYYFFMSVYGWYNWVQKKENHALKYQISWCSSHQLFYGLTGFAIAWVTIYFLLTGLTDSNTPILDSLVSSSAVTAMWWMAQRKIENWLAWIFSNIVAIPLNFYKGFMLFTLMYILFLVMAFMGYLTWKSSHQKGKSLN
ncbi:MAG: nicotinamide mononucleotide transporter [Saprospiraceae bacterium]|nr:nicotinamide mononucleotide transporter [Saprospiraceae bacterium]